MNALSIDHLLAQEVIVTDKRRPLAAWPRYRGSLFWDIEALKYTVGVYGLDFISFRPDQVTAVDGHIITIGGKGGASYSDKQDSAPLTRGSEETGGNIKT
jgi:hypothetical protein